MSITNVYLQRVADLTGQGEFHPEDLVTRPDEFLSLCGRSSCVFLHSAAWGDIFSNRAYTDLVDPVTLHDTLHTTGHLGTIVGCDMYTDAFLPLDERVQHEPFAGAVVFLKRTTI